MYISNDLSYQERAKLRVKVQELKVKREQQPDVYWTIKGCRIVSLGPRRRSDLDEYKSETDSDEDEGLVLRPLSPLNDYKSETDSDEDEGLVLRPLSPLNVRYSTKAGTQMFVK